MGRKCTTWSDGTYVGEFLIKGKVYKLTKFRGEM